MQISGSSLFKTSKSRQAPPPHINVVSFPSLEEADNLCKNGHLKNIKTSSM